MISSLHTKLYVAAWVATSLILFAGPSRSAQAQNGKPSSDTTNVIVIVKEADSGQPVSQAHITLQFSVPGGPGRLMKPQKISYNAKTDTQGRYKFVEINKGPIVLTVIAPNHQTYGKELQLDKDNQVFEVKLKKPQPLI
jgi:Flp pilus assembly protein CpaB